MKWHEVKWNEWLSEWINEWMNAWMDELISDWHAMKWYEIRWNERTNEMRWSEFGMTWNEIKCDDM